MYELLPTLIESIYYYGIILKNYNDGYNNQNKKKKRKEKE